MKILRKIGSFLLYALLYLAVLGFFWYMMGDFFKQQFSLLLDAAKNAEAQAQYTEQTADMRQVLGKAQSFFLEQTLVSCTIKDVCPEYDTKDVYRTYNDYTWDRERALVRENFYTSDYVKTFIQGDYNPETYLSEAWSGYFGEDISPEYNLRLLHGETFGSVTGHPVEANVWYYHKVGDHFYDLRNGTYVDYMPYAILNSMQMIDYEEVGLEDCGGQQAIHYIVTHKPILLLPMMSMDQQFVAENPEGEMVYCGPEDFFDWSVDQQIKDAYPEYYEAMLELMDKRFYQDAQTHLWITEEGKLLRIQWDYTFESYYGQLADFEPEEVIRMLEEVDSRTGELVNRDFAELLPVIRTADFCYGEEVEPIQIPEEAVSPVK